ncbi:MAG TPA: aminomethyl-transferring glycine dehydrogenase [Luteibaculaceae bacterium]|nr:aminomethyl-transferring glycine dehydrogenase [Luteibaculaceae bacterium]
MNKELFSSRHIGISDAEIESMLKTIGVSSVDQLIDETIPAAIRLKSPLKVGAAMTEFEYLQHLKKLASKNKVFKNFIGLGYYPTITPSVILRNIFENPGWYTAYTPYQAEIAQGRLEALLNYQTMVIDLTGMEIANASLLDEGTAAAEAMQMFYSNPGAEQKKNGAKKIFVSHKAYPQTIDIIKTRAGALGIEVEVGDWAQVNLTTDYFAVLLQYPDSDGVAFNYKSFVADAKAKGIRIIVAADILSLALLTPPGEWGADAVVGNSQRFGVPMGYGGPHAAFFASKDEFKRSFPGRIIGVSVDREGLPALRMALQTREQHIRRDKATSNICTAQALLAVMASMYAVYHGPDGIKRIAENVHAKANLLGKKLATLGFVNQNNSFFDTVRVQVDAVQAEKVRTLALKNETNLRYEAGQICISVDEVTTIGALNRVIAIFAEASGKAAIEASESEISYEKSIEPAIQRSTPYLTHPVFNRYHSESEMMRYLKKLENKDISLTHSMIPLGSCTMKLNAASELIPLSWPEFANLHPFAPVDQAEGYRLIFEELEADLAECTGFAGVSLQPNSGAQGEYAGLMVMMAYHKHNNQGHRNVVLIPSSAHGTNPASAVMAGMKVVVTKTEDNGNIDIEDIRQKASEYKYVLAGLMVTYPSTHGVFEEGIKEITGIIHENGGLVYMDGANMNAQVGLTSPGNIGADVCHLNLHKTFAIPHGGGGPGMGPIGVAKHLVPFLPGHPLVKTGGDHAISAVSAAPWGSSLILLISYGYIKMLGSAGLTKSTEFAILNANYIKARIQGKFDILYTGNKGHVAHEMIVDLREFKTAGIEAEDVAKRLMDYGFHAPTLSFPVAGTIMIEPTESESKAELDRFSDALLAIRQEMEEVVNGTYSKDDNPLKGAPHTALRVTADYWPHSYSRQKAAYPLSYIKDAKFWPSVNRVDNAYGDRNLICACPSVESYQEA